MMMMMTMGEVKLLWKLLILRMMLAGGVVLVDLVMLMQKEPFVQMTLVDEVF